MFTPNGRDVLATCTLRSTYHYLSELKVYPMGEIINCTLRLRHYLSELNVHTQWERCARNLYLKIYVIITSVNLMFTPNGRDVPATCEELRHYLSELMFTPNGRDVLATCTLRSTSSLPGELNIHPQ